MKTIKLLFAIALCFFNVKNIHGVNSIKTSTLVNPCAPQVSITPFPNTYGCYSITAYNSVPNDPDSYYQWNFQDGTTAVGKIVYHCCSPVTVTTNYTLSLTYTSPTLCGPLSNVQVFTITLNPPASTLCVNNTPSVTLAANSVTVWSGFAIPEIMTSFNYGDGSATSQTNTHTYPNCGNYIITINSWDMNTPNNICYSYAAVNITCPNPTGITDLENISKMVLYPNPATEFLNIKITQPIKELEVFDLLGKKTEVLTEINDQQNTLHTVKLTPGSYIVKIQFENGQKTYRKFIKQ
ncbi:MAG: T9SS type A sorting domain-containing protein [Bacteroidetes bacterium]|nr:T9SS type A sorting domain-containing protein [Bacteroidota bacterium]